jgi:DNA protecting protein DprA
MLLTDMARPTGSQTPRRLAYTSPDVQHEIALADLLTRVGRAPLEEKQLSMLKGTKSEARVFYSGNLDFLDSPCVSIVGTRDVSPSGWRLAEDLARSMGDGGVTVVSGLAKGVDTAALTAATKNKGRVAAVIGTPLDKAYPAENAALQQHIYSNHLLLTPFANGEKTFKSSFPIRNRVMAAVSDATVIVEASDTSGTLHQAAECVSLGRWLFIAQAVLDDRSLTWPKRFLGYEKTLALKGPADIFDHVWN